MSELQELVDSLAAQIGRSVDIDDHRFRLVVFSSHRHDIDEVRRTSILHREAPEAVTRMLTELGVQSALGPMRIGAAPGLGLRPRVCIPIRFDGFLLGYMWLIEDTTALEDEHLDACVEAARHAALLMYRERILDDHSRERERQCVIDLLDVASERRVASARSAIEEAILAVAGAYGVIVVEAADEAESGIEARVVTILAALERARRALRPHACVVGNLGGRGVLILAVPVGIAGSRELGRSAERLSADLRASGGENERWQIGQGPPVPELASVLLSYKAALDANQIATAIPKIGEIAAWEDLGAWKLLSLIPDDDRAHSAIHPALARVAELRDGPRLLETLELFLDRAADVSTTAQRLHIHRASLYARLRRIERETGVNLSSGEDRLELHISLRLQRLMGRPTSLRAEGTKPDPAQRTR